MTRTPDEIRAAFSRLRENCDPRGHGLLDELERLSLRDNAILALQERLAGIQNDIVGITVPAADVIPFPGYSVHAG